MKEKIPWPFVILVLLVAGVAFVLWVTAEDPLKTAQGGNESNQSLEENWDKTIRRYGIEPVFPPEEDLTVGDLLAVIVKDEEKDLAVVRGQKADESPFLKRSVKIAHIDLRKQLEQAYSMLSVFPGAAGSQAGGEKSGEQTGTSPTSVCFSGIFPAPLSRISGSKASTQRAQVCPVGDRARPPSARAGRGLKNSSSKKCGPTACRVREPWNC